MPAALFASFLLCANGCYLSILVYIMALPCHEVGHAVIYWLNSQLAFPGPGETWALQSESSYITYLIFAGLLAWGIHAGKKTGNQILLYGCVTTLATMTIVTLLVPRGTVEQVVLYSGLGGEIYIGAIAALSFYAKFPPKWNWEKNRFLFLAIGAVSYVQGGLRWFQIQKNQAGLPMGALNDWGEIGQALGGSNFQSNGDLDRLMRDFHWAPADFAPVYIQTFWITTLLFAAAWAIIAHTKLRSKPTLSFQGTQPFSGFNPK